MQEAEVLGKDDVDSSDSDELDDWYELEEGEIRPDSPSISRTNFRK